eukprot:scaffold19245_cov199-Amphora_coffeaeformis.AAC.11
MTSDFSNSSVAVQPVGGSRYHPQPEPPHYRGMPRRSLRLFPIQEMHPAYECGLLEVPIEHRRRPRRPGTEFVRRCSPSAPNNHHTRTSNTNTSSCNRTGDRHQPLLIPIAPGVMAKLRGVEETVNCIANDYYLPANCFCCAQNMFCIMDACYVLCPTCKVVSPLVGGADSEFNGGVGLGFTVDDLQKIQCDIYTSRQR